MWCLTLFQNIDLCELQLCGVQESEATDRSHVISMSTAGCDESCPSSSSSSSSSVLAY